MRNTVVLPRYYKNSSCPKKFKFRKTVITDFTFFSQGKHASSGPSIEDWQLPNRYRRRPIDEKECDAINSGGAF